MSTTNPQGFIRTTKTAAVKALKATFNGAYPVHDFRDMNVSIEFPNEKQEYPALWVDFEPSSTPLRTVGISHTEYAELERGLTQVERWRFEGYIAMTCIAFSSGVRDLMLDEMVRICAFAKTDPVAATFRTQMETNEWVAITLDWDQVALSQISASPGTPWGTDEYIYEGTTRIQCLGEFISNPDTGELIHLREVKVYPIREGEADPTIGSGWS